MLHEPFQYMLERLASQKLEPYDLRTILRLGNPLACLTYEERQKTYSETPANQKPGSFIPLTRIKTLVSMTTPRDLHVQNNSILPPFIEMDMSPEGFGCIYLPSIAPYNPNASAGVTALASQDGNLVGGIGSIERSFPPHPGLTFATWICIDKFSGETASALFLTSHVYYFVLLRSEIRPSPSSALDLDQTTEGPRGRNHLLCCMSLSQRQGFGHLYPRK